MPDPQLIRDVEERVVALVHERHVLLPGERVLLMLSGGADSMALLDLVRRADRRLGLGLSLAALHVDYGLRGDESSRDRAIVRRACERGGIPLHEVLLEGALRGSGFQQRARDLRFERARSLAAAHGCDVLATGHTADDQAETVLYRLVKYGAPSALAGMAEREGDIARPLLCLRAGEVREYCAETGIEYGEDVSNSSEAYARNVVRLSALPALERLTPRAVDALAGASVLARDERALIDAIVDEAWKRALIEEPAAAGPTPSSSASSAGGTVLDAAALAAEPAAVRRLLVRRLAATALGEHALIGRRLTAALDRLASGSAGSGEVALRDGWAMVREYERLYVRRRDDGHACEPVVVALDGQGSTGDVAASPQSVRFCAREYAVTQSRGVQGPAATDVWLGLARPVGSITLRHPRAGDRFEPLGWMRSTTVLNFLKEQKVPRAARTRALVVEAEGEVAWVEVRRAPRAGTALEPAPASPEAAGPPAAATQLRGRVARSWRVSQSTVFTVHLHQI